MWAFKNNTPTLASCVEPGQFGKLWGYYNNSLYISTSIGRLVLFLPSCPAAILDVLSWLCKHNVYDAISSAAAVNDVYYVMLLFICCLILECVCLNVWV